MDNNKKTIKTVKGFNSELKCRDQQYEVGKTYELPEGEEAVLCNRGFHAVSDEEPPLKVFDYYPPAENGNRSRYCLVEVGGKIKTDSQKIAGSRIKIGAELGIPGLIKAHIEWVKSRITNENNAEPGKQATAGNYGAATARGSVSVGANGVATVRGNKVKARGGMGAILTIAEEKEDDYDIMWCKTIVIDGHEYKPDTWYGFEDGEIVELEEGVEK